MTRKVFVTDLREIKTVKVKCRICGYAVDIPIDNPEACPDGCARCQVLFASGAVGKLMEGIHAMQKALFEKERFKAMQVVIETEDGQ